MTLFHLLLKARFSCTQLKTIILCLNSPPASRVNLRIETDEINIAPTGAIKLLLKDGTLLIYRDEKKIAALENYGKEVVIDSVTLYSGETRTEWVFAEDGSRFSCIEDVLSKDGTLQYSWLDFSGTSRGSSSAENASKAIIFTGWSAIAADIYHTANLASNSLLSTDNKMTIQVLLGPVLSENSLRVMVYDASGEMLLDSPADVSPTAQGFQTLLLNRDYQGPVLIHVWSETSDPDYLDEATNAPKDLGYDLRAMVFAPESNTIAVTPLTELAVRLFVQNSEDLEMSPIVRLAGKEDLIRSANSTVADAFKLDKSIAAEQTEDLDRLRQNPPSMVIVSPVSDFVADTDGGPKLVLKKKKRYVISLGSYELLHRQGKKNILITLSS
jgi:hypothetical protein